MDKLSTALKHFSVSAGIFYSGSLCGSNDFDANSTNDGHLHFVRRGKATLIEASGKRHVVKGPAIIFFPRPASYRLAANIGARSQVVCGNVRYGTGTRNPVARALPPLMIIRVEDVDGLQPIVELLIDEAFNERNAREAIVNRLLEMLVISLIRHVLDEGTMTQGMLAGLSHPQLHKAILAIHEEPQKNWSIEELAELSAMSRSKFFKSFLDCVGITPGEYILEWRIALAQDYLKLEKPVGWIANAVGYENSSAFAKMFRKKTGFSPKGWMKAQDRNHQQAA